MIEIARSFDMDDTIVEREKITRVSGLSKHIANRIRGVNDNDLTLDQIVTKPHHESDRELSAKGRVGLFFHLRRGLLPGAAEGLEELSRDYTTTILNTGRNNDSKTVGGTRRQLRQLGIDGFFHNEFFKPSGMSSTESKADVLRYLNAHGFTVEHFDDDPRTQITLARLFPGNEFYLVKQSVTSLIVPSKELAKYPNIHVISSIADRIKLN